MKEDVRLVYSELLKEIPKRNADLMHGTYLAASNARKCAYRAGVDWIRFTNSTAKLKRTKNSSMISKMHVSSVMVKGFEAVPDFNCLAYRTKAYKSVLVPSVVNNKYQKDGPKIINCFCDDCNAVDEYIRLIRMVKTPLCMIPNFAYSLTWNKDM